MNLLYEYSKQYWKLFAAALLLAATNQIFSLLDPLIFRHVIDSYATNITSTRRRSSCAGGLLCWRGGCGVCVAGGEKLSGLLREVIVQRLGARMYSDGIRIRWICRIKYLKTSAAEKRWANCKSRSDVERFITAAVNVLFISLIGIIL